MTTDDLIRAAAVFIAVALVAAPYWEQVRNAAIRVAGFAKDNATSAGRIGAAVLLIAAAWGRIPLPTLGSGVVTIPISVETPSKELRDYVGAISAAMKDAPMGDRLTWAAVWQRAAKVVAGDVPGEEQIIPDTKSLRLFNVLALDIGWKRIGEHKPGQYVGLRAAVERTLSDNLGTAQKPVDAAMRAKVVEVYKAIAWAGMNRE